MALYSNMTPDEAYARDEAQRREDESWNDFYHDLELQEEIEHQRDLDEIDAMAAYYEDLDR